jgi:hypothetical protein
VIHERRGGNAYRGLDESKFEYNAQRDIYRCLAGRVLRRRCTQKKDSKAFCSCDQGFCRDCKFRSECVSSTDIDAVRQVTRFDTPYIGQAQAACAGSQGKRLLKKRQTCMEGLFGQAKSQHGLDRARLRGLVKMQIQGLLTAMVLIVKKLLQAVFCRRVGVCCVSFYAVRHIFIFMVLCTFGLFRRRLYFRKRCEVVLR